MYVYIVCRKLVLEGGWFSYSNNQSLNSMATYHCNDGLELINNSQRTCMIDGQWNGSESSCARLVRSDNSIYFDLLW